MRRVYLFLTLLLFSVGYIFAKPDTLVVGKITTAGKPLVGANVSIKGTNLGAITNSEGEYAIILKRLRNRNRLRGADRNFENQYDNIFDEIHTIKASFIGYVPEEKQVKFERSKINKIDFDLKEDILRMHDVVVTSTREEINRKESPVVVNILDLKTFETTNSLNLADGFSFQPGLRLETNCQNCGFQQVRINGLEGPYSQILIDSRPVFTALNSVYGIEQIPANMIDRVEIIRGGGSALYGSNAIGGTINIITKVPLENSFEIASNLSFIDDKIPDRTTTLNASLINNDFNLGLFVFGAVRERTPYDANGDGFSEIGKLNNETIGFRSFFKASSKSKINFEYHYLHEFRRGGNKFNLQPHETDITEQAEHFINSGNIDYSYITQKSNFNLYFAAQKINRNSYYGAQQDPNAYGITTDITFDGGAQYSYYFDKFILSSSNLVTGIEYQTDKLHDQMPGYHRDLNQTTKVFGFYAQNEWKGDKYRFLIGARMDKHNLIKDLIFSPRTALLYNWSEKIQTRISYGQGYRAPQAFDEDLHITAVGGEVIFIKLADNLSPEKSNTVSCSFDLYPMLFEMQTNFLVESFYTRLNDVFVLEEIGVDNQGNKIVERRNGSGAEVYGVNFEGKIAPSNKLDFQFGFTIQRSLYLQPEQWSDDPNVPPTKQMPRTPDNYGYFTFNSTLIDNINFSISCVYTGSMYVPHYAGYIPVDEIKKSEEFFELNSKLAYTILLSNDFGMVFSIGVQNIFNSYQKDFDRGIYRDAGYMYGPSHPRTAFLGIKLFSK